MRRDVWVGILLVCVQCNKADMATIDASAPTPTAITSSAPIASAPLTDYPTLAAARHDGDKAIGKTALANVTRERMLSDRVLLSACWNEPKDSTWQMEATYRVEQRPLVRAIPSTIKGPCRRAIVRVTGNKHLGYDLVELLEVFDVQPTPRLPSPPGVDYTSIDDVLIDGDAAAGKVARLDVRRQPGDSQGLFMAGACDVAGAFVEVHYVGAQSRVAAIPTDTAAPCTSVTVKLKRLANRDSGIWIADLVDTTVRSR